MREPITEKIAEPESIVVYKNRRLRLLGAWVDHMTTVGFNLSR
jgi:hypothetical protein